VDSIYKSEANHPGRTVSLKYNPTTRLSIDSTMIVFLSKPHGLEIVNAANNAIVEGTGSPVSIETTVQLEDKSNRD